MPSRVGQMVVFWNTWKESPTKTSPTPTPRVDAEGKSGEGSQISLPGGTWCFPACSSLLKSYMKSWEGSLGHLKGQETVTGSFLAGSGRHSGRLWVRCPRTGCPCSSYCKLGKCLLGSAHALLSPGYLPAPMPTAAHGMCSKHPVLSLPGTFHGCTVFELKPD